MVREASQRVPVGRGAAVNAHAAVIAGRAARWMIAAALCVVGGIGGRAIAQDAAGAAAAGAVAETVAGDAVPEGAIDAALFGSFPTPALDIELAEGFERFWPSRLKVGGGRGLIIPIDGPIAPPRPAFWSGRSPTEVPVGVGHARKLIVAAGVQGSPEFSLEGTNSFVVVTTPREPGGPRHEAPVNFVYVSGTPREDMRGDAPEILIERTWFSLYPPEAPPSRGIVLFMPGLLATPEPVMAALTRDLRADGWAVLRMIAQPSRFTERVEFVIDPEDIAGSAEMIARTLGERVAEVAYAADAAVSHVQKSVPALADVPVVVLGFSGGAMTIPPVVSLTPERYKAAVLVGGGADYWLINERSNYRGMIDALRLSWDEIEEPSEAQRAALDRAYLERAPLDAYHTAAHLRGVPTLMIHAASDLAVPAPLGVVLWEKAGRPEMWVRKATHETLFMGLTLDHPAIVSWLDRAVPRAGAGAEDEAEAGQGAAR